MTKPANPPAFPNDPRTQLGDDYQGMTLLDYFAGQVASGMSAHSGTESAYSDSRRNAIHIAERAYAVAEAMLAVRGDA